MKVRFVSLLIVGVLFLGACGDSQVEKNHSESVKSESTETVGGVSTSSNEIKESLVSISEFSVSTSSGSSSNENVDSSSVQEQVLDKEQPIGYEGDYFILELPASWKDKYGIDEEQFNQGYEMSIYEKSSHDMGIGGKLIDLIMYYTPIIDQSSLETYTYLGKYIDNTNSGKYFLYNVKITDMQYNSTTEAQYKSMQVDVDFIIKSISPKEGWTFSDEAPSPDEMHEPNYYTEDAQEADTGEDQSVIPSINLTRKAIGMNWNDFVRRSSDQYFESNTEIMDIYGFNEENAGYITVYCDSYGCTWYGVRDGVIVYELYTSDDGSYPMKWSFEGYDDFYNVAPYRCSIQMGDFYCWRMLNCYVGFISPINVTSDYANADVIAEIYTSDSSMCNFFPVN